MEEKNFNDVTSVCTEEQKERSEPVLTADGKVPNAVLVFANGGAELIHLDDLVSGEALGEPIDCDSTNIVLNRIPEWSEKKFGIRLAGYVDSAGIPKGFDENERIQSISGYDCIAGDCVLLGIDSKYNYLPLSCDLAVEIWKYFK